jgi:hypothetical protein
MSLQINFLFIVVWGAYLPQLKKAPALQGIHTNIDLYSTCHFELALVLLARLLSRMTRFSTIRVCTPNCDHPQRHTQRHNYQQPRNADETIDGEGHFMIPGLIDSHVRLHHTGHL